jgi:hypothetical protein
VILEEDFTNGSIGEEAEGGGKGQALAFEAPRIGLPTIRKLAPRYVWRYVAHWFSPNLLPPGPPLPPEGVD